MGIRAYALHCEDGGVVDLGTVREAADGPFDAAHRVCRAVGLVQRVHEPILPEALGLADGVDHAIGVQHELRCLGEIDAACRERHLIDDAERNAVARNDFGTIATHDHRRRVSGAAKFKSP